MDIQKLQKVLKQQKIQYGRLVMEKLKHVKVLYGKVNLKINIIILK